MAGYFARCLVVGLGNRSRSDDAVGVVVAEELRKRILPPSVEVVDGGMDEFGLIERLSGTSAAVIVDAVSMGRAPGTIRTFLLDGTGCVPAVSRASAEPGASCPADNQAPAEPGAACPAVRNLSLHGFGLAEVIGVAVKLGARPRIAVVGIQPQSTAPGEGLSETVRSRLPDLVQSVLDACDEVAGARGPSGATEAEAPASRSGLPAAREGSGAPS